MISKRTPAPRRKRTEPQQTEMVELLTPLQRLECKTGRKYKTTNTDSLTSAIVDTINLMDGARAYRTNCGMLVAIRYNPDGTINDEETIKASLKYNRYNRNSSRGMCDITAVIHGVFVGIEVKNKVTGDRQSAEQRQCESQIVAAGGVYVKVHTYNQFYSWLQEFVQRGNVSH